MGENILIHLFCSYEFKEEHALPWGLDNKVLRLLMSLGMSLSVSPLFCSAPPSGRRWNSHLQQHSAPQAGSEWVSAQPVSASAEKNHSEEWLPIRVHMRPYLLVLTAMRGCSQLSENSWWCWHQDSCEQCRTTYCHSTDADTKPLFSVRSF